MQIVKNEISNLHFFVQFLVMKIQHWPSLYRSLLQ